jgi:type IV secretory pathway TrbD component
MEMTIIGLIVGILLAPFFGLVIWIVGRLGLGLEVSALARRSSPQS